MSNLPKCPKCNNAMDEDTHNFMERETSHATLSLGERFPAKVVMKEYENYVCYKCDTRVRILSAEATYSNPEIKEF